MDLDSQIELEIYFADHFDTVLFPVLADIYQSKADYVRAKRVCEIGLEHHPESVDGQFILSQAEMALGNLNVAEKLLKKVLEKIPSHQPAAEDCRLLDIDARRGLDLVFQYSGVFARRLARHLDGAVRPMLPARW